MSADALFDVPRSELEQALDARLTRLTPLTVGDFVTAAAACHGSAIQFLEKLAAGECVGVDATAVEQWAATVVLRDLGDDLQRAWAERAFVELQSYADDDGAGG